MFSGVN